MQIIKKHKAWTIISEKVSRLHSSLLIPLVTNATDATVTSLNQTAQSEDVTVTSLNQTAQSEDATVTSQNQTAQSEGKDHHYSLTTTSLNSPSYLNNMY